MAKAMMDYVVHFAATGNPNGKALPEWPPYRAGRVMDFAADGQVRAMRDPWTEQLDLVRPN